MIKPLIINQAHQFAPATQGRVSSHFRIAFTADVRIKAHFFGFLIRPINHSGIATGITLLPFNGGTLETPLSSLHHHLVIRRGQTGGTKKIFNLS